MKSKIPLEQAQQIADNLKRTLSPACERIEIAGSVRRQRPEIGDIEIVCIPKTQKGLFDEVEQSILDPFIDDLVADGVFVRGDKNGPKFKNFILPAGLGLDLFITTPPQWGLIFTIRTGPDSFSRRLVTKKQHGGYLPSHLRSAHGWLWDGDKQIPTPTETNLFDICGLAWIEPQDRK